jgi:hypothetical protein
MGCCERRIALLWSAPAGAQAFYQTLEVAYIQRLSAGQVTKTVEIMTLLVNSKTYEKVVLHMTFEGPKSQGRSPVKPTRMALEIGRCCINQQSRFSPGLSTISTVTSP